MIDVSTRASLPSGSAVCGIYAPREKESLSKLLRQKADIAPMALRMTFFTERNGLPPLLSVIWSFGSICFSSVCFLAGSSKGEGLEKIRRPSNADL
jgi:hypothetical protein